MNMDFSFPGERLPFARRLIRRRMRQLDIDPLDHAGGIVRFGVITLAAFVTVIVLFALLAPLSGAAVTTGQIVSAGSRMLVQPIESGLVTRVLVHEGQPVRAGQPLVELDPLRSGAQFSQARARHDALLATEARLAAERDQAETLSFPADLTERARDPQVAAIMAAQQAVFTRHASLLAADRRLTRAQLTSARAQAVAVEKQRVSIGDELASYRQLYREGFARKTTVRSLERTAAQLEADRATSTVAMTQAEIQAQKTLDTQAMDAATQLDQVRQQLAQIEPQLAIARDSANRAVLRAPAAGRVSSLSDVGPGTMVGGGKTVLEVVPDGRALIAEVSISPKDIDDVKIGQPVTLRFSSVNPHGKTAFVGHVVTLSPNRIGGPAGDYYKAQIAFDDPVQARRDGLVLQPGIPVSANIKTKDRNLFQYLFFPLIDAMSRAFREE